MPRLVALSLVLVVWSDAATAQTAITTHDPSRVLIEYDGATQLSADFASMSIRIRNRSGRDRDWVVQFTSTGGYGWSQTSRFELEVEDGGDRTFELLIPLVAVLNASWIQMQVFGSGVQSPGEIHLVGNAVASTTAINLQLPVEWDVFQPLLKGESNNQQMLALDPERLSSDWRAYAGLTTLWFNAETWKDADPVVRRAITDWVSTGGRLVLVEDGDTVRAEPIQQHGLGLVLTLPADLSANSVSKFVPELTIVPEDESVAWANSLVEPIEIHKGLLSIVLLGYLVLAAPVNLLVLSPRSKRIRLFWTMPAIALGASALLGAVIVLQDGLGGTGVRTSFVYLLPGSHRELLVQEQVSRTGALLGRSFEIGEDDVMTSLQTSHGDSDLVLASSGARYEGDWFRSRSVQAHRIQRSRPSRARIEQVGTDGGAPRILSSIDDTLAELYYRDSTGVCWHAADVHPGRPMTLKRASEADYASFRRSASYRTAGPRIRAGLTAVFERRGAFLAVAANGTEVPVETLPSILWMESPVLYGGHIEGSER